MADSPFPQEEAGQEDRTQPVWNPWEGPAKPHWYSGLGFNEDTAYMGPAYRVLESFGSGAAKMELGLGKLNSAVGLKHVGDAITEDARERIKALTPDAATTGWIAQTLHGVFEGAYLVGAGSLTGVPLAGAANVGLTQGVSKYDELKDQGITTGTALSLAGLTGVTSAAGAVLPFSYGSTLLSKVATGAAANAVFGGANRYATGAILDANGYHDMAEQQKVWDSTQVMADLILGGAFGAISHFQEKAQGAKLAKLREEHEDAAMTANLANADQRLAPGIATDPEAANAHSAALEKAVHQVLSGEKVDVSDTGIEHANFVEHPEIDHSESTKLFEDHLKENGFLDEEQNLRDLVKPSVKETVTPRETSAYTVQEAPLTDEQLKAFQGLRSHVPGDENVPATAGRGTAEQGRPSNAGGRGEEGAPLRVYRGGERPVGPSHFEPETLGVKTTHPSSGLGVFFTSSAEDAAQYGRVSENLLDIRNPKIIPLEDMPQFDSIEEARALQAKFKAEGYDGIVIDGTNVGGPNNYVAFSPEQVLPTGGERIAPGAQPEPTMTPVEQVLAARPDMTIPTENGPMSAQEALSAVQAEVAQDSIDIPRAVRAAITCFGRFGS